MVFGFGKGQSGRYWFELSAGCFAGSLAADSCDEYALIVRRGLEFASVEADSAVH